MASMPASALVRADRVFVALRKAKSGAALYHAVTPRCRMALCASEPGAGSGWAEPPGERVTCPQCLRRLGQASHPAARRATLSPA
jgi:hypothetical protein